VLKLVNCGLFNAKGLGRDGLTGVNAMIILVSFSKELYTLWAVLNAPPVPCSLLTEIGMPDAALL
jgi:hypothetical protein